MTRDVDYVNHTPIIAENPKVTAINSCIEVDITGQVVSDAIGTRMYSGKSTSIDSGLFLIQYQTCKFFLVIKALFRHNECYCYSPMALYTLKAALMRHCVHIGCFHSAGVGGQIDFIRGAALSEDGEGKPIIALPSATKKGESKIVPFIKPGIAIN